MRSLHQATTEQALAEPSRRRARNRLHEEIHLHRCWGSADSHPIGSVERAIDTFKPNHGLPRAEKPSEFVAVHRDDLREALYGGNGETAFGEALHRLAEIAPGGEP
jgi:hypothetical protein